jgi:Peptidase S46
VTAAVKPNMPTSEAVAARRAVIAEIEQESLKSTGLRSDVVTLYGGGRYHLYRYKKYTDVRLVWAPEAAIAFFGGDADNFEYPRYDLDATIFRVYEDGKPAKIEHFLRWSDKPIAENELIFVSGNPGRTNRIYTTAALKFQRDRRMPYVLNMLRRREISLQQFAVRGVENSRRAKDEMFSVQNSRKAYLGMLGGLQDPAVMKSKQDAEDQLLKAIQADPALAGANEAFKTIAEVQQQQAAILGKSIVFNSQLFQIAKTIVELVEEGQKPARDRLPEYSDAGRESLEQQLYSEAPLYADLETHLLADGLSLMLENRGGDDPLSQKIMAGKGPADRAAELVSGTKLMDVSARRALVKGGKTMVANSQDPLILLALALDSDFRHYRKIADDLAEKERQAYAKISEAIFKTRGTSTYPDATFTLRMSFGVVKGYEQGGQQLAPFTTLGGTFAHEAAHLGQKDFVIPESWKKAKSKIAADIPFNFVSSADIIGGNSGSPVVNRAGELVGLIFDGNLQSLPGNYIFDDRQMRATSVSSQAIEHTLEYIYDAKGLVDQLGK